MNFQINILQERGYFKRFKLKFKATYLLTYCAIFLDVIESRKEIPLLNLLKKLGGWPVLMGEEWIEEVFDWQDTIAKLRQYNNDILVFVWVGPDGKDSDDYIVQVTT